MESNQSQSQSQSHGFIWENEIREKVFELKTYLNHTGKYDINAEDNKWDNRENISIKTSKSDSIDCGDILRFFQYDFTYKNTIIIIQYKQEGNYKIITNILEIDYNEELHKYLFGSVTFEDLKKLDTMVKNVPFGLISVDLKKEIHNVKSLLVKEFGMNIRIGIKIDSKNQRRIQCSIVKIHLLEKFIKNKYIGPIIREINIIGSIYSLPRIRHKKIEKN